MKKYLLSLIIVSLLLFVDESSAMDNFTLYLVRHAEKQRDQKNPALTACGELRANSLATLLSQVKIDSVYSTHFQRTMLTAAPLAKQQKVSIKNYSPRGLAQLAILLKKQHRNAFIVGHSNTTPQLVEMLTGKTITPLTEQEYQQLYQIQFIGDQVVLTLLKLPLVCK